MSTDSKENKQTDEVFPYNSSNPFISGIVEYIEDSKHKRKVGHSWQDVVDQSTGSINKQHILILGEQKIVDTQEYAKVYMDEIQRFFGLSKKTLQLLKYIMKTIRYNEDRICLYYPDVKDKIGMIKTTMYSAIKQMLRASILAKANTPGCYYINPAVVFKGERIALVKQFVKESVPSQYNMDTMQLPYTPTTEEINELYKDKEEI